MRRQATRMLFIVIAVALLAVHGQARTQNRQAELARLQARMDDLEATIRVLRDLKAKVESRQLVFNGMNINTLDFLTKRVADRIADGSYTPENADRLLLTVKEINRLVARILGEEIDNLQKEYDKTRSAWIDANWLPESGKTAAARWVGRWSAAVSQSAASGDPKLICSIVALPDGRLCFTNEVGKVGCGHLVAPNAASIDDWPAWAGGGLRALLFADGNRIDFANGTFWTRYVPKGAAQ